MYKEITSAWHWDSTALLRAFFRVNDTANGFSLIPGPLGTGLINTVRITLWTICFTLFYGVALALLATSHKRFLFVAGQTLIAITRNLPPLVLVFIIHFFLAGQVTNLFNFDAVTSAPLLQWLLPESTKMPMFLSAVITLTLYEGAYVAAIFAGCIQHVDKKQWEAAASLGFTRFQQIYLIIIPQALRYAIPPLTGQTISLIKDSAILSVISVQELTFQGLEFMTSSGLTLEIWVAITLCYLTLCAGVSGAGRYLELREKW